MCPLTISRSCTLWLCCRVHHKREGKDYALKVFKKGPQGLESQRTEVAALLHLQAVPDAVRYKEHGEHQGQAWLVETWACVLIDDMPGPPCEVGTLLAPQAAAGVRLHTSGSCSQHSNLHHRFQAAQHCSVSAHLLKLGV